MYLAAKPKYLTESATADITGWTLFWGDVAPHLYVVCIQRLQHKNCTIAHAHCNLVWLARMRSDNRGIDSFTIPGNKRGNRNKMLVTRIETTTHKKKK